VVGVGEQCPVFVPYASSCVVKVDKTIVVLSFVDFGALSGVDERTNTCFGTGVVGRSG
jgi:hypothetical protein